MSYDPNVEFDLNLIDETFPQEQISQPVQQEQPIQKNKYVRCGCGVQVTVGHFRMHLLSRKHYEITNGIKKIRQEKRVKCECGKEVYPENFASHLLTRKHINVSNVTNKFKWKDFLNN